MRNNEGLLAERLSNFKRISGILSKNLIGRLQNLTNFLNGDGRFTRIGGKIRK